MDKHTGRGMDSHSHGIRDRVIYPYKLHRHTAKLNCLSWRYNVEFYSSQKPMLLQLALNKTKGKPCAVNRHIEFFQKIRQTAYMILMTVCKHNAPELFLIFLDV